jgi:preprotein translocase subunit SecD
MAFKLSLRVWILIIALLLSLLAMGFNFNSGVVVKSVEKNTTAFDSGLKAEEIIKEINGQIIKDKATYTSVVESLFADGVDKRIDIKTSKKEYTFLANSTSAITVEDISLTKIQTGLDLRGGARALVQPDGKITDDQLSDLISVSRNRFNVYGLADVNIKGVSDLDGNKYMLIEVAGATPADLEQLIAQQGKFEARIANQTVFEGGKEDIADVCRNDAKCSGIQSCSQVQGGYACQFMFSVYLTQDAAEKHASITGNLSLDETGKYLKEKLYLFVDNKEVDSLNVGAELRGKVTTQISIQGPGTGRTQEEAYNAAKDNMNKLQTILITGSLPYKLNIVKLDTISPILGSSFSKVILLAGAAAMGLVALIIFIRYRRFKASLALLLTSFSEIVIILGVAALIKWNLDLPSIAGILATIGTGVDQQIVILDEARKNKALSIIERMKRALFIIMSSYFASVVSLLPLYWAGAGLFKGFAITTIIGITAGVLITRPAFSDIIKHIEE